MADMTWIPVTERLPDATNFLVCTDLGLVGEAFLLEGFFFWQEYACHETLERHYAIKYPTHWMPLPEPPKEVER